MKILNKEYFNKNIFPLILIITFSFLWRDYMNNFFEYSTYGLFVISLLSIVNDIRNKDRKRKITASEDIPITRDKFNDLLLETITWGKYFFLISALLYWSLKGRTF